MQITEHLPLLARQAKRFSIVRSMTHTAINHNAATYFVTTGNPPPREQIAFTPTENDFPHLGAQVAFGRPNLGSVPTAVSLPDPVSDGPYTCPGQNGGCLGARYSPFSILGDRTTTISVSRVFPSSRPIGWGGGKTCSTRSIQAWQGSAMTVASRN